MVDILREIFKLGALNKMDNEKKERIAFQIGTAELMATPKQIDDMYSFIKFGIENNYSPIEILIEILHDTKGIMNNEKGFVPRTMGYSDN